VGDDVPDNPDSIYPAHDSGAPTTSWSVSESVQTGQSAGGTAGSMMESKPELYNPEQQPSVGESSV
ncbi:hypothetical protein A2U01_0115130, partial [Trifolium medium]|nr:hypothetical protein [Trifolium medium]